VRCQAREIAELEANETEESESGEESEAVAEPQTEANTKRRFFCSAAFEGRPQFEDDDRTVCIDKRAVAFMGDSFGQKDARIKLRVAGGAPQLLYLWVGATYPDATSDLGLAGHAFARDGTQRCNGSKIMKAGEERSFCVGDVLELVYKYRSKTLMLYVNGEMRQCAAGVNDFNAPCVSGFTLSKDAYRFELLDQVLDDTVASAA